MSTKQMEKLDLEIEIPKDVNVKLKGRMLQVQGPLGKTHKSFRKIPVNIEIIENKINLKATGTRKKHYAILNTSRSLIRTLCEGIVDGYTIKMKIVYSHFPISVKIQNNKVLIENFQGERAPRIAKIWGNTKVVTKGDDIIITGMVLTDVTQTTAEIELKTKVKIKITVYFLMEFINIPNQKE